jgi:hypothetical protein
MCIKLYLFYDVFLRLHFLCHNEHQLKDIMAGHFGHSHSLRDGYRDAGVNFQDLSGMIFSSSSSTLGADSNVVRKQISVQFANLAIFSCWRLIF